MNGYFITVSDKTSTKINFSTKCQQECGKTSRSLACEKAHVITVNSEIFARVLFSRIALKHIFATLEIRDNSVIYLYQ